MERSPTEVSVTLTDLTLLLSSVWSQLDYSADPGFWNEIHCLLKGKTQELRFYEKHLGSVSSRGIVIPGLGMFSVISIEIVQQIFMWLSLVEIVESVKRVCKWFAQATDVEQENMFWKKILKRDWKNTMIELFNLQNNTYFDFTEGFFELSNVEWSIQQRGYYNVGKTMWMQVNNKMDHDWLIQVSDYDEDENYRGLSVYEGTHKNRVKSGRGRFKCLVGDVDEGYVDRYTYEGEWHNNSKHGRGTMKFANGDVYKGGWRDNLRHGRGTSKFANGNSYVGDWVDGVQGRLTMTYPDGSLGP